MTAADRSEIRVATSIPDALALIEACGTDGEILAGATWIMRAPLRGEEGRRTYIAVSRIAELGLVALSDEDLRIGSCVTHAGLAEALRDVPEFAGLRSAAEKSANPQVRSSATVGGNICTPDFAAADVATALLCLDASICLATAGGTQTLTIADFLRTRHALRGSGLVTAVVVPRGPVQSAHARLPLRKAGDYPVAIVSVAARRGPDGTVDRVRIAVGSVEPAPRRWFELEHEVEGKPIDSGAIAEAAAALAQGFSGRDGVETAGWYRVRVLPSLVRRAFDALRQA